LLVDSDLNLVNVDYAFCFHIAFIVSWLSEAGAHSARCWLNTDDGIVALVNRWVAFLNKAAAMVGLLLLTSILSKWHYPEVVAGVMRLKVTVNEVLVVHLVVLVALVEFDSLVDDEHFGNLYRVLKLLRP
jgi:hypothetical protein